MTYCHSKSDVSTETHLAVVRFRSITIPGDERSRTHPGHGYPAENMPIADYIVFKDRDELQAWIEANYTDNNFIVLEARPRAVVQSLSVSLA